MPGQRHENLLEEWRVAASGARLPTRAPDHGGGAVSIGLGGAVVAALIIGLVVVGTQSRLPSAPGNSSQAVALTSNRPGTTTLPPPSAPSSTTFSSAGPVATAAPSVLLPSPGGTCRTDQFSFGTTTSLFSNSSIDTSAVNVLQPIVNNGAACVLQLPTTIAVAPVSGLFQLRPVGPADNATKFNIGSKQSTLILLHAWWSTGNTVQTPPPSACEAPVMDATRVIFPFAHGTVEIDLAIPWHEVCRTPTHVTATVRA